jgi:hypothetical protein
MNGGRWFNEELRNNVDERNNDLKSDSRCWQIRLESIYKKNGSILLKSRYKIEYPPPYSSKTNVVA